MLFNIDSEARTDVSGWILADADAAPVTLDILLNDRVAASVGALRPSPHLVADHPEAGSCGFDVGEANVPGFSNAETVEIRAGAQTIYRSRRVAQIVRERLFFMHIPKTGGTTLNHVLEPLFESSYVHLESHDVNTARSLLGLKYPRSLFLSGHALFHDVAASLLQVPTRLVTILREPLDHLISHMAWIYHVSQAAEHLANHTSEIVAIGQRIAEIDLDDEGSVAAWIDGFGPTEQQLFFNSQARFLGSDDLARSSAPRDLGRALDTMRAFDAVGRIEKIDLFVRRLDRVLGADLGPIPRLRVNPGVERFQKIRRFEGRLRRLLEMDHILYARLVSNESVASRIAVGWRRQRQAFRHGE